MFRKQDVAILVAALCIGYTTSATAELFSVNTQLDLTDSNPGDGVCQTAENNCSLRAAIQEANSWPGLDTIELPAGLYPISIADSAPETRPDGAVMQDELAASGDLDIRDDLIINGAGSHSVAIDGSAGYRVFDITQDATVYINDITIRNGSNSSHDGIGAGLNIDKNNVSKAKVVVNRTNFNNNVAAFGGAINVGFGNTLILNHSTVTDNSALSHGAGINNNNGIVEINNSVIRHNRSTGFGNPVGGGIYNAAFPGSMTIRNSTIADNTAAFYGGGIYHVVGRLNISNSTISGNTSYGWGGGLYITGGTAFEVGLHHVTIVENFSVGILNQQNEPRGGGIHVSNGARVNLVNSIVARNGATHLNCYIELDPKNERHAVINKSGNIIEGDSCLNPGETAAPTMPNPGLNDLDYYGGPTPTHSLISNSDAINGATPARCLETDQRGFPRDGQCDSGAYEFGAQAPVSELQPVAPFGGPAPTRENDVPIAFGMPMGVKPGETVLNIASAADHDGDFLRYEIVTGASQGTAAFTDNIAVDGEFNYRADADASGSDSFTFRACDRWACSEPATITMLIETGKVAQSMGVELKTGGTVSELTVFSEQELSAIAGDLEYSAPFGAFFFDVADIPADGETTEVVIQFPNDAEFAANAVVRKLDRTNTWKTLQSGIDPSKSTANIDPIAKTITLTLRDNDIFDLNPAPGVIADPVALSVPKAQKASDSSEESEGGVGGVGGPNEGGTGGTGGQHTDGGGGGTLNLWLLALASLLMLGRRRG